MFGLGWAGLGWAGLRLLCELTEPIVEGDVSQRSRDMDECWTYVFLIGLEFVEFIPPATTYIYLIAFVYAIKQISVVAGTCPLGKVVEESRLLLCRDIWCLRLQLNTLEPRYC